MPYQQNEKSSQQPVHFLLIHADFIVVKLSCFSFACGVLFCHYFTGCGIVVVFHYILCPYFLCHCITFIFVSVLSISIIVYLFIVAYFVNLSTGLFSLLFVCYLFVFHCLIYEVIFCICWGSCHVSLCSGYDASLVYVILIL